MAFKRKAEIAREGAKLGCRKLPRRAVSTVSSTRYVSSPIVCTFLVVSALWMRIDKKISAAAAVGSMECKSQLTLAFVSNSRNRRGVPHVNSRRIQQLPITSQLNASSRHQPTSASSRNSQTRTRSKEDVWHTRYDALVEYKGKHGDTSVPLSHPDAKLAIWVRNQRHQYRHLINGRYSSLTPERIRKLDEINFDWGTPSEVAWRQRYEQLVQYKSVRGDCSVPEVWDENPALGRWVVQQRVRYRNLMAGTKPDISEERVTALTDIGFEWDFFGSRWSEMLERAREILSSGVVEDESSAHGSDDRHDITTKERSNNSDDDESSKTGQSNGKSPRSSSTLSDECNSDVRVWIDVQRYHYARLQRGESSSLSPERIQRLEEIPGFKWTGSRGPNAESSSKTKSVSAKDWSDLFQEAKEVDVKAAITRNRKSGDDDGDLDWDGEDLEDLWSMEDD